MSVVEGTWSRGQWELRLQLGFCRQRWWAYSGCSGDGQERVFSSGLAYKGTISNWSTLRHRTMRALMPQPALEWSTGAKHIHHHHRQRPPPSWTCQVSIFSICRGGEAGTTAQLTQAAVKMLSIDNELFHPLRMLSYYSNNLPLMNWRRRLVFSSLRSGYLTDGTIWSSAIAERCRL